MPAPPARASLFPAGALLPASFKTLLAEFFDYTIALLGSAGTAADALAALGSGAGWAATVTGGTATAFTLTPSEASTANAAGQRYRVNFHTAAGVAPTLAVSGQIAKNLKFKDSAGAKQAITSTHVPSGWVSDVEYDGTDWVVLQVTSASAANTVTNSANDTTYDVSALAGFPVGVLVLSNGNTRTITNFTNAIPGQVLLVINEGGAAVVTIDRTNAYLFGGGNQALAAHNVIALVKYGALWYQIAPVSTSA